jgi:hypothetical protein
MLGIVPGGMHLHHRHLLRIGRFPQADKSACFLCFIVRGASLSLSQTHIPVPRTMYLLGRMLTLSFRSGNMMTNVATLMARTYVAFPESAGCQFQAFLIQMLVSPPPLTTVAVAYTLIRFMPADAFWILAMAINVYLTFYAKFDAQKLRKMEIPYLLLCYGVPFIVALVFIFVSSPAKGKIYGDATLWCWVKKEWDIFRIITFYGPVW